MKVLLSWLDEFGPFADPADNDARNDSAVTARRKMLDISIPDVPE